MATDLDTPDISQAVLDHLISQGWRPPDQSAAAPASGGLLGGLQPYGLVGQLAGQGGGDGLGMGAGGLVTALAQKALGKAFR